MNGSDVDELREVLHPLVRDVESEAYPPITADSLARRKEAQTR